MAYGNWTIGGIVPTQIENVEKDPRTPSSNTDSIITFHCVAALRSLSTDPRAEIALFDDMACQIINNDQLINGGSKLQVQGGNTITITEHAPTGDINYKAALELVKIVEDDMADKVIKYDIIAHYETSGAGTSKIYVPSYYGYSNITQYYEWYYIVDGVWTKANADASSGAYGTELGFMQIVETKQIKKVEVYGSTCRLPGAITVDGSIEGTKNWNYYHDPDPGSNQPPNQPFQVLDFNFAPNNYPTILTLHTTEHHGDDPNHGCWLKWIRVYFV